MSRMACAADSTLGCPTRRGVGDLALEVGEVDLVVVHQRDVADAGCRQVQRHRRAQPAGADDQRVAGTDALLAVDAELFQQDVARVAQQVVIVHARPGPRE
jgi:hypothetical protein